MPLWKSKCVCYSLIVKKLKKNIKTNHICCSCIHLHISLKYVCIFEHEKQNIYKNIRMYNTNVNNKSTIPPTHRQFIARHFAENRICLRLRCFSFKQWIFHHNARKMLINSSKQKCKYDLKILTMIDIFIVLNFVWVNFPNRHNHIYF